MIGERLRILRKEKGLSLTELAEKSNVAKSYLSAIERGIQANPSIQVIEKLSGVLGVPVQQILANDTAEDRKDELDAEWLELTREVANAGISKEQFREWLEFQRWRLERGE
ncbi:helix-turn-helix domain-containing protein [Alicyclobacillus acidiphilus]|uniref:helix-turn-helix domain-containing protein n=1 Tax=Alicyclobacillus acidiphilus TaxID=182455 RepID=UPI00082D2C02|nr:helix-turn-helix domain-containing protein [Alicyclobacillus acidiphilus]